MVDWTVNILLNPLTRSQNFEKWMFQMESAVCLKLRSIVAVLINCDMMTESSAHADETRKVDKYLCLLGCYRRT